MISFASSVQGEPALTPSLIAFYATVATVIPVLFIALAVQGTTVQWLAVTYFRRAGDLSFVKKLPSRPRAFRVMVLPAAALALSVVGAVHALILVGGVLGEFFAIYALYQGADTSWHRFVVLVSVTFLIIMVAAGPLVAFFKVAFESRRKAAPPATSSAEPDKKDAQQDQQPDGP